VAALLVDAARECKILVSAGTNYACDVFFNKLREEFARLGRTDFDETIVRCLSDLKSKEKENSQNLEKLATARVVIATCVIAGKLGEDRFGFSHVFLDEAGQCTEPESLIPLTAQTGAQWILAGDHKQLGPVVLSPFCANEGKLGVSLFERLIVSAKFESLLLTKNYRSHPEIVSASSALFYDNALVAMVPATEKPWGYPIAIRNCQGSEKCEGTSRVNRAECRMVLKCIRGLTTRYNLDPVRDMVVITPHAAQVDMLEAMLRRAGKHTRVGCVETFQGDEAKVVILSTVRSSVSKDGTKGGKLGFLTNYKGVSLRRWDIFLAPASSESRYHHEELIKAPSRSAELFV
jgi:superfamily I DNA and/or RNA helicase